jgi:hypothetical protein
VPPDDLSHYAQFPTGRRRGEQAWRDRLDQIHADFPSVDADAHSWLDDEQFIPLMRDVIAVGLRDPHARGHPRPPTPEEARVEWARLVTAVTGSPPEPPEPRPPRRAPNITHPGRGQFREQTEQFGWLGRA